VAQRTTLSGNHCTLLPRQQQLPLALENQPVLRHGFVPANRPEGAGAGCRQHKIDEMRWRLAAGDTIIDDRWTAGDNKDKEGSRQEQTAINHVALKAGKWRPAERAVGNEKGKDDANKEDT
jgi:hypothetical protein